MPRARVAVAALVLVVLVGTSVAYAAGLVQTSSSLTLYTQCLPKPAVDASVFEDDGSNHGSDPDLVVRSLSPAQNARALVYFDLSPCELSASSQVDAATFELFMSAAPSVSQTYEAHRLTATWDESTVVWGNQPTAAATATASATTGTSPGVWLAWDVMADVASFAAGGANYGWRVSDQAEGAPDLRESTLGAREHADATRRPRLTIGFYP